MNKKVLLTVFFVLLLAQNGLAKTILIIESYHSEYPWDASYLAGIREVIGDNHKIQTFQMNTKRIPADEYAHKAEEAWDAYMRIKPDLVILGDDNALKYIGPNLLTTHTPAVYLGINCNPREYFNIRKSNFTGVLERPLLKRSIVSIRHILKTPPKRILVLFDSGETSCISISNFFDEKTSLEILGITIDLKLIGKLSDWEKTVSRAEKDGYDALVIGLYQTLTDDKGNHVNAEHLMKWTSENTPVPPFCFWDFAVGKEAAIGGLVLFGKTQGEAAGKQAMKILSGISPHEVPVEIPEKGRFYFSRFQMEKWKISLPEDIAAKAEFTD